MMVLSWGKTMANKLGVFYHNLATMLEAGVPILRALQTAQSGFSRGHRRTITQVIEHIRQGDSLAAAMARYPWTFRRLDRVLVDVGETSGNLPDCLQALAHWYEVRQRSQRILLKGLPYPSFIINAVFFILPLPPLIMGETTGGDYLWSVGWNLAKIYLPTLAIWLLMKFTPDNGLFRQLFDYIVNMIPGLGKALKRMALSRYCRAFSLMLKAGVPAVQGARHANDMVANTVALRLVAGAADAAADGQPFSSGFKSGLPFGFLEFWQTGEETGKLEEMTRRLADNLAELAEDGMEQFATWLPRLLYFIILVIMAIAIVKAFMGIIPAMTQIG